MCLLMYNFSGWLRFRKEDYCTWRLQKKKEPKAITSLEHFVCFSSKSFTSLWFSFSFSLSSSACKNSIHSLFSHTLSSKAKHFIIKMYISKWDPPGKWIINKPSLSTSNLANIYTKNVSLKIKSTGLQCWADQKMCRGC